MKPLVINTREREGVVILDLQGDINAFGEGALNQVYSQVDQTNPRVVVLNFSAVDYINSSGIALIVSVMGRAKKNQRQLMAYGVNPYYRKIFEYTGLAGYMSIMENEEAVISVVNP